VGKDKEKNTRNSKNGSTGQSHDNIRW